jgi:type IV pilus assembly protein PilM
MSIDWNLVREKLTALKTTSRPKESVIGLDFNHTRLVAVEVQKKGARVALTRLAVQDFSDVKDARPRNVPLIPWGSGRSLGPAVAALMAREKVPFQTVHIALSGPVVLTRFIQFPKMNLKDLRAAMKYEIEKYIPFEANDVIADFHILGDVPQDKRNMKVILVAAKKTKIFSLIEALNKINIKVRVVDIQAFACYNAFTAVHAGEMKGLTVLLDIGYETSSLMILADKEPAFIREISIGDGDVADTFRKKMGLDDPAKAGPFDLGVQAGEQEVLFAESVEPLLSQIRLSVNYFMNNNPKAELPGMIYLSGELCEMREFQNQIKTHLDLAPRVWDCLAAVDIHPDVQSNLTVNRALMPVSIGLALRTG